MPVALPYRLAAVFLPRSVSDRLQDLVLDTETAIPPYTPVFDPLVDSVSGMWEKAKQFNFENYTRLIFNDDLYIARVSVELVDRVRRDVADTADRLSDGLWHGARAGRTGGQR